MLDRVFGKSKFFGRQKVQNYGEKLCQYIEGSTFDLETGIFTIPEKEGNFKIPFYRYQDIDDIKNYFSKQVIDRKLDLFEKIETLSWYKKVPFYLKNNSISMHTFFTEDELMKDSKSLSFLKQISDIFDGSKIYFKKLDVMEVAVPYLNKKIEIDTPYPYTLENFKKEFLPKFVEKCVNMNRELSNDYLSNQKLNLSLEKVMEMDLPSDVKEMIAKSMDDIPKTKEDFVNLYKTFLAKGEEKCFYLSIRYFTDAIDILKSGPDRKHLNLDDREELGRLLISLENMAYGQLTEEQERDYEKAKNVARTQGYKEKVFYGVSTGSNILIGKYFYLCEEAIVPDLDSFKDCPKEFFDVIESIEDATKEDLDSTMNFE